MKASYAIAVGASVLMVSAGTWLGCSSDNAGPADAGPDSATGSSGSSSGGSSSGTASSSGSGGGSSSSSGGSSGGSSSGAGSSSSSSGGSSGSSGGAPEGGVEAGALTWSQVYADVIAGHCAGCHGGAPAPDGGVRGGLRVGLLNMSTVDAGYAGLINVAAQGTGVPPLGYDAGACNTLEAGTLGSVRVVPRDAGASLLFLKVHGYTTAPPCGNPMPEPMAAGPGPILDGGQDLAAAEIMNWINQGALP